MSEDKNKMDEKLSPKEREKRKDDFFKLLVENMENDGEDASFEAEVASSDIQKEAVYVDSPDASKEEKSATVNEDGGDGTDAKDCPENQDEDPSVEGEVKCADSIFCDDTSDKITGAVSDGSCEDKKGTIIVKASDCKEDNGNYEEISVSCPEKEDVVISDVPENDEDVITVENKTGFSVKKPYEFNRIKVCGKFEGNDRLFIRSPLYEVFNADLFDYIINYIFGYHEHSARRTVELISDEEGGFGHVFKLTVQDTTDTVVVVKLNFVDDKNTNWVEKDVYKVLLNAQKEHYSAHIPADPKGIRPFEIPVHRFDENKEWVSDGKIRCLPMKFYKKAMLDITEDDGSEALRIIDSILNDLVFFHESKFIHRDIKPGNIVGEKYVIIDWGTAIAMDSSCDHVGGTGYYICPDRYTKKDGRYIYESMVQTDLYSVGILLLRLLIGDGIDGADGVFTILRTDCGAMAYQLDIEKAREKISHIRYGESIIKIVEKACIWKDNGRGVKACAYKDAREMLADVKTAVKGKNAKSTPQSSVKKSTPTPVAFSFMTAVILLLSAGLWYIFGSDFQKNFDLMKNLNVIVLLAAFWGFGFVYPKIMETLFDMPRLDTDRMTHTEWIRCSVASVVICSLIVGLMSLRYDIFDIPLFFYTALAVGVMMFLLAFNLYVKGNKVGVPFVMIWGFLFATGIAFACAYLTVGGPQASLTAIFNSMLNWEIIVILLLVAVVDLLAVMFLVKPLFIAGLFFGKGGWENENKN
ncbi:MAG: hypothetical protein E7411_00115 [Ruminococcaceae bacterium]|nr:hypothetical protein [Oscillospiraceae bacterium]